MIKAVNLSKIYNQGKTKIAAVGEVNIFISRKESI